jgi:MFS family permease
MILIYGLFEMSQLKEDNLAEYQKEYSYLKVYSFFWWAFYSLLVIFTPLYLIRNGFPLWAIFLNGALEAVISLFIQNFWAKQSDHNGKIKEYMILGNIFIVAACIFIIFVDSFWKLLFLTLILRSGPSSDVFATVLSYRFADKLQIGDLTDCTEVENKNYNKINVFAQYRKYGSIGWAFMAPIGGLIINKYGFTPNFIFAAIGFIIISLFAFYYINFETVTCETESNQAKDENIGKNKIGIIESYKNLFKNKVFANFMIAVFIFSIATQLTYQSQGIFYGLFAPNNYVLIALTFSVAALMEWPIMSIIAKRVNKTGWEKMVLISYISTAVRFTLTPLLILLNGNIWWAYLFQISTGIIFGMRLPSTTFGIHIVLKDNQKTLGQSLNNTLRLFGSIIGSIFGAIISYILVEQYTDSFIYIYWLAATASFLSALFFFFSTTRMHQINEKKKMVEI